MAARISVCIPNYNGMALIDACIDSLQQQDIGEERFEIIIHDDASTDDSVAYIRRRYPQIKLIVSEQNVGFCIACNRMAEVAGGDYLLLLNNDARLWPDALATLLLAAKQSQQAAIFGLPQYDADSGQLLDIGSQLDLFLNPVPMQTTVEVGMVAGACLWIDKTLWQELGGFPEWFVSIAEDLYLCCRARLAGYPVKALATSGYRHYVGSSFGGGKVSGGKLTSTFRRRALSERNKTFVMLLTYPLPALLLILPLHLCLLLLEGLLLSLLKTDPGYLSRIYLPVFAALLHQHKQLLAARRQIQHQRRLGMRAFFSVFQLLPYKLGMLLKHGLPKLN